MPIYEYACGSCGHVFDVLQKMDAAPLLDCPECGEPELKKLLSAPNFRLKGGGWYETDFKKNKQRNLAGDVKPAADADKKPADTGKTQDSQPAAAAKSASSGEKSD